MQGAYTGTWASDALYHFAVFGTDLHLEIQIDGKLNGTVSPNGTVTGTASGSVQAPITHDGARDVSSGYGTITGAFVGTVGPTAGSVTLETPVIDMHWGTFVAGGYTVEKFITMPDYTFSVGTQDCTSTGGVISEENFPVMAIVADGANEMTYAPGLGSAAGSWTLQSSKAAQFASLSGRVDTFIADANSVLTSPAISAGTIQRDVAVPLKQLLADVNVDPDLARCLLERLATWERTVVDQLRSMSASISLDGTPESFRHALDLARSANMLAQQCGQGADAVPALVESTERALHSAVTSQQWGPASLLLREVLLAGGNPDIQLAADLHVQSTSGTHAERLATARFAYASGDDADARAAVAGLIYTSRHALARLHPATTKRKPKRTPTPVKTRKPKPTVTPRPSPTARPTTTPRPTPRPTLSQVLTGGIESIALSIRGGAATWEAIAGATRYVVMEDRDGGPIWAWSGSGTTTFAGDTLLANDPASGNDAPPSGLSPTTWSILALDDAGTIVGASYRVANG
jgi:hypothetical protein